MLSLFPRDVLNEIRDLIESVSKGFPTYSYHGKEAGKPSKTDPIKSQMEFGFGTSLLLVFII